MAKRGRPIRGNASYYRVTVRFTEAEYNRLKEYAKASNKTMTNVMKDGIDLVYQSKEV